MDREKERKIKNIIQYILAVVVIISALTAKFMELINDQTLIISLFLGFLILSESDITDVIKLYLKK